VAVRHRPTDKGCGDKHTIVHKILKQQPMLPDRALIVIGIHHQDAVCFLSEQEIEKRVKDRREEMELRSKSSREKEAKVLEMKSGKKRRIGTQD
jgi:hypothetical protein